MYKRRVSDHCVGTEDKSKDHRNCDRRIADILARQFTVQRNVVSNWSEEPWPMSAHICMYGVNGYS